MILLLNIALAVADSNVRKLTKPSVCCRFSHSLLSFFVQAPLARVKKEIRESSEFPLGHFGLECRPLEGRF